MPRLSTFAARCDMWLVCIALAASFVLAGSPLHAQQLACPKSPSSAPGKDFHGQTLGPYQANFSRQDLTNANFEGATLIGAVFIGADLTGANFRNATIIASSQDTLWPTDFSFANLASTCFIGAQFKGTTYFTYSTLSCADFSQTDISHGNAVFGDAPLKMNTQSCRIAFRSTVMNCEFVDQWGALDLTGANVRACSGQLAGRDFSGAEMSGVDFTGTVLDGAKFVKANLAQALFNNASMRKVDMSNATLFSAQLNSTNLEGANLYRAFLANNVDGNIANSASMRQAHLKNANLSFAELSGVNLNLANFYGDNAAGQGACKTAAANYQGFTQACASAHGAVMTDTTLSNAYLYGVDFTSAAIAGSDFSQSVLTGSNFAAATLSGFSQSGKATTFNRAFLQGVNLAAASMDCTNSPGCFDLTGAFVDFTAGGNNIYVLLNGINHNSFAGCPTTINTQDPKPPCNQDVCVFVSYAAPTTIPSASAGLTCPDGTTQGCGPATPDGSNRHWASALDIGNPPPGVPPAWYDQNATYTPAPTQPSVVCGGKGTSAATVLW